MMRQYYGILARVLSLKLRKAIDIIRVGSVFGAKYASYILCQVGNIDCFRACPLTHCGLVMPYGDIDLGQNWLR